MQCKRCDNILSDDDRYCYVCGEPQFDDGADSTIHNPIYEIRNINGPDNQKDEPWLIRTANEAPWGIRLAFMLIVAGLFVFLLGELIGFLFGIPASAEFTLFEDSGTPTDWTRAVGILSFLIGLGLLRSFGRNWSRRDRGLDIGSTSSRQETSQQWSLHNASDQVEALVPVGSVFQLMRQPLILSAFAGSALCGALVSTITIYYLFGGTKEWGSFLSPVGTFFIVAGAAICLAFSYFAMDIALPSKTTKSNSEAIRNRALIGAIIGIIPGCIAAAIFTVLLLGIMI